MSYKTDHFYRLENEHVDAYHTLEFFKETIDGKSSYWINACENPSEYEAGSCLAIRFTEEDLIRLRDSIDEVLSRHKQT